MISLAPHSSLFLHKNPTSRNPTSRNPLSRNPSLSSFAVSKPIQEAILFSRLPSLRCSFVPSCDRDSAGYRTADDLEAEILDFMQNSPNPNDFPTKDELIAAGRVDLVEAIAKEGGWLALGWNLEEEDEEDEEDERMFQMRLDGDASSEVLEVAASSGRSTERETREVVGIEGILSRLEKERTLSFGMSSGRQEYAVEGSEISCQLTPLTAGTDMSNNFGETLSQDTTFVDTNSARSSHNSELWRTWSSRRAGLSESEFEAAEIIPLDYANERKMDDNPSTNAATENAMYKISESTQGTLNTRKVLGSEDKENLQNQIRSRLQHLEQELSSVLNLLRSRTDVVSQKDQETSVEVLHRLSDAWEFQQTEIMKARDKLRSTRAKLAVLEGKIALEIIEAQRLVEDKQRRINDAQRALRLLRTACIVWPNSASVVLLAGSFDGWTSQRRMERSSSGIFSLNLKLYPGRYEIKFIVDGVWMIDPLRPTVHNNGCENNLFIVS